MADLHALYGRIDARRRAISNMEQVIKHEQQEFQRLETESLALKEEEGARIRKGTCHARWKAWRAERRAKLNELKYVCDQKIKSAQNLINRHMADIELLELEAAKYPLHEKGGVIPTIATLAGIETLTELERLVPEKNPHRKYVAKGERRKKSDQDRPKNKNKAAKSSKKDRRRQMEGVAA